MKKIIVGILCSTILLGGVLLPTTSVLAEEATVKTEDTYLANETVDPILEDISVDEVRKHAKEIGININDSEIIITDSQMFELFNFMGYDLEPQQSSSGMSIMSAGVTKVMSKGSGSWDIYLSKGFLKVYYGAGTVLASGLTVAVVALVPGLGWAVASTMAAILSGILGSEANNGVVFRIRNWKISSTRRQ